MLNTARVVYRFCAKSSVCSKLKRVIDRQSGRQTDTVRCRLDYCNSALAGEGVHDLKLHHPSSSVATSNQ